MLGKGCKKQEKDARSRKRMQEAEARRRHSLAPQEGEESEWKSWTWETVLRVRTC